MKNFILFILLFIFFSGHALGQAPAQETSENCCFFAITDFAVTGGSIGSAGNHSHDNAIVKFFVEGCPDGGYYVIMHNQNTIMKYIKRPRTVVEKFSGSCPKNETYEFDCYVRDGCIVVADGCTD